MERANMEFFYPTAFRSWGAEEADAIARVLICERFTMGAEVAAFEQEFAAAHGKKHCIMVNSGSSANLVAVAALFNLGDKPLRRGDTALVPALAWSTTYAPLVQHDLNLVLVDCDSTWNAGSCAIRDLLGSRLIVACSILGNPGYLPELAKSVSHVTGQYLIEDNCESLWASPDGTKKCGTYGIMSTFSFFWSHQLSAIEGGAILTDDDECATLCRMLRAHGWTRDVAKPRTFDEEYDFHVFGYNVRPLEMHAAIAREQLKKQDNFQVKRRSNFALFQSMCETLPVKFPQINGAVNPFGIHFTVGSPEERQRLVTALRAASIDCRLPTGGSFRLHQYGFPWRNQSTPQADHIHRCGLFLGNAPFDISDKIERAVKVMRWVLC